MSSGQKQTVRGHPTAVYCPQQGQAFPQLQGQDRILHPPTPSQETRASVILLPQYMSEPSSGALPLSLSLSSVRQFLFSTLFPCLLQKTFPHLEFMRN